MLIVGAKGFAKEVLEVLHQSGKSKNISFFDNVSNDLPDRLFELFPILRTEEEVVDFFRKNDSSFTLGLGSPITRYELFRKLTTLGGSFTSTISPFSHIGHFNVTVSEGCNIMTGVVITNDIYIGKGCLINLNCTVGHDTVIGEFTEISPGVAISGGCKIGNFCNLGTNATILPKITIGNNVVIGAGAVVTQDLPNNCLAVGVPAKIIKQLTPLEI